MHKATVPVDISNHVNDSNQRWDRDVAQNKNADFFLTIQKLPFLHSPIFDSLISYRRPLILVLSAMELKILFTVNIRFPWKDVVLEIGTVLFLKIMPYSLYSGKKELLILYISFANC